ncbi:MAG: hypothetical protein ACREDM_05845 [Methylocella sp.]
MPRIDVAALANPVSENDPCGPDLDGLGDVDFLNFVTLAEGLLPSEFFTDGAPSGAGPDRAREETPPSSSARDSDPTIRPGTGPGI